MSLLKQLQEADQPVFKPASPEELTKRREGYIIPIDKEAKRLKNAYYSALGDLELHLRTLRMDNTTDGTCECALDEMEEMGEIKNKWDGVVVVPGEDEDEGLRKYCLRCGGSVVIW